MAGNPKVVAKGALDQRGERLALLGRTGLGGSDQAIVDVERRPHAEIRVALAGTVNCSEEAGIKSKHAVDDRASLRNCVSVRDPSCRCS